MINNIKYLVFKLVTRLIFLFIDLYMNLKIFLREHFFYTPYINTINFIKSSINIDGLKHEMYQIGDLNANDMNTIIMIGGIPTDPVESMMWLADELNQINPSLRIIIFNIPVYENHFDIKTTEYTAKANGKNFITKKNRPLSLKGCFQKHLIA